ncbi:MAG: flagellar FliJ family protein [Ignavibacteriales bacterium]|nr:flagellar FliJ family protein [Ignavibacteriales bacterium]
MKFTYKFESIKRIKEVLQKKVQKEISEIDMKINLIAAEMEKLELTIKAMQLEVGQKKHVKVAEMQHLSRYEDYLSDKIKSLHIEIKELERQRALKLAELQQKQKEQKIFEVLETKKREEFRTEENHLEQITLDEIANQKYLQGEG